MKDIVIIGGGITGTAIAHQLAAYQLDILLVEKDAELSFGVSKSNSGIIHTGFQSPYESLKAKLAVRGNQLYHQLADQLDFALKCTGELIVAFKGERDKLEEMLDNGKKLGVPKMQIVDSKWLNENEPALSEDIECALLGETAAVINPYEVIYAMAENAAANGVEIRCGEKVTGIGKCSGYEASWKVLTDKNEYETKYVINAAGLFADEVSAMAGIPCEPIRPRKGEELLLDRQTRDLPSRIIFPLPQKNTKGILVIPTAEHTAMIGPTAVDIDDKEDLTTSLAGKEQIMKEVQRLVPTIQDASIIAAFAGLRPATASGDFHINEDAPGLINLIGIQSPGLTAAPAIAEMVTNLIKESAPSPLVKKSDHVPTRQSIPRFRELSEKDRNALIITDSDYGEIVCRCETVTRGEIKEAIRRGARTLDGIKFRTRCQMGRCHGAFCTMKIMAIIAEELGVPYAEITKRGARSKVVL
ncbi:MAG: NAD(P)/FAD-dependent oxidoreductase [Candidatus Margulisiibacteriota bacterium]